MTETIELGKSEALLKGENATLRRAIAIVEHKNELMHESNRLLNRKLSYATRVGEESKSRIERLEGDKTVLIIWMLVLLLVTNAITFMAVY